MSLPFLQLEEDFVHAKAPMIAAMLRTDRRTVIGMGVDLFDFIVRTTSTEEKAPDGILADPDAVPILEGVMGWTGEQGRCVDAFVRARVIEPLEVGARVRGTERYRKSWEKLAKERARKAAWRESNDAPPPVPRLSRGRPADKPRTVEPEMEMEMDMDIKTTTPNPSAEPDPPAAEVVEVDVMVTAVDGCPYLRREPRIRWLPTVEGCWEFLQLNREIHGLQREAKRPKRFAAWAEEALIVPGPAGIDRTHSQYLQDRTIRAMDHPTAVFISTGMWDARRPLAEGPEAPA